MVRMRMAATGLGLLALTFGVLLTTGLVGCRPAVDVSKQATIELPADSAERDALLRQRLDDALDYTYEQRTLNLRDNAAWQIMHGVLTYGMKYNMLVDGESHGAVQWVLEGNEMNGWTAQPGDTQLEARLYGQELAPDSPDDERGLHMVQEPGTKTGQGHPDQWLAILAQCDLPSDTLIRFRGVDYDLGDVLRQAMWNVKQGQEVSWTLIATSRYLPLGHEWMAKDGQRWNIEKIAKMEASYDTNSLACGGSHSLIGMAIGLRELKKQGGVVTGGWLDCEKKVSDAIETIRQYQNPDGSFSSNFFVRPSHTPDLTLQINTSGHQLEFLTIAMTDEQLREPWVEKAVLRMCDLFDQTKNLPLECGSLYHAAHALILYRERRFGPYVYPQDRAEPTPSNESKTADLPKAAAKPEATAAE